MKEKASFKQDNRDGDNNVFLVADSVVFEQALTKTMSGLIEKNLPELLETAQEKIIQRVNEFQKSIVESAIKKIDEGLSLSKLAEPNTQFIINESQINYVRYPGKDKLKVLSELLSEKICNKSEANHYDIFLDETISVISKLSQSEIDLLTYLYAVSRLYTEGENYVRGSFVYLFDLFLRLFESFKNSFTLINRLNHLGAVSRTSATMKREESFILNSNIILSSIKKEDFPERYASVIIENEMILDSYRSCGNYKEELIEISMKNQFKSINDVINRMKPEYLKYKDCFEAISRFDHYYLTYIGEIIATINLNNHFNTNFSLEEVIQEYGVI